MNDLTKRLSSAVIGLLLLIFIIAKGGYLLYFSLYIVSIIGLREFYKAIENVKATPCYLVGYLGTTGILLSFIFPNINLDLIFTIIILILLIIMVVHKGYSLKDISLTLFGIIYIPFLLFHIGYLDNTIFLYLIFIIAFGTDTFAYIIGNLFGKNKLSPTISPNKTIEGFIGGILGSVVLVVLYSVYFKITPLWSMILLSILTSILSQLGDLAASKIKRITKIKDFGNIMPGHGGVLDRFDSIIFAAPIIYYYTKLFLI
ncbi:MAG: phosphatidate cytidylyltransferase [Tissierellia bacterium]|nr:phosphatidate cytidylyltransferase [Tissierellia bacterium]